MNANPFGQVRGSLMAMGRPDGRLNGLASAENTASLSLSQASSIQNFGVTCESITIGHNPYKLPLSASAIFLPGNRRLFLCEKQYEAEAHTVPSSWRVHSLKATDGYGSQSAQLPSCAPHCPLSAAEG